MKSQYKEGEQFLSKGGKVQIFGTTLTNQNSIQEEIRSRK
jgi:hypothetical protein